MPQACRLTLDIPPSANELFTSDHRLTPKYRAWREAAGWQLQTQPRAQFAGPFRIVLLLPENMRGDTDNRLKAAQDLLTRHRVIPDDRFARSSHSERSGEVKPGECVLIVEAA